MHRSKSCSCFGSTPFPKTGTEPLVSIPSQRRPDCAVLWIRVQHIKCSTNLLTVNLAISSQHRRRRTRAVLNQWQLVGLTVCCGTEHSSLKLHGGQHETSEQRLGHRYTSCPQSILTSWIACTIRRGNTAPSSCMLDITRRANSIWID